MDFDATLGKMALSTASGSVSTPQRMATYAAFIRGGEAAAGGAGHAEARAGGDALPLTLNGVGGSSSCDGATHDGSNGGAALHGAGDACGDGDGVGVGGGEVCVQRLREAEAMSRLGALVERMQEMEAWFDGAKAEAGRERQMREQGAARLSLMQERLERATAELSALRKENDEMRGRLEDLVYAAKEDGDRLLSGGAARRGSIGVFSGFQGM